MSKRFKVYSNTQITYEDLKIGVAYIVEKDFTDQNGIDNKGMTGRIYPFIKGEDKGRDFITVYEGQEVQIGNYLLEIIDIKANKDEEYIKIKISSNNE